MPTLAFVTLDVFATTRFQGNPLAVLRIPPGHNVSTAQMQSIAREFNLSETVFLHESTTQTWHIRIFMTEAELPFAGHPTIGTACYALGTLAPPGAAKGRLMCPAGPIEISFQDGRARASIPHNVHRHSARAFTEDQVFALQPGLQRVGAKLKALEVVSPVRGMNFICVELESLEALAAVQTSGSKPEPALDEGWEGGFAGSYFYVVLSAEEGAGLRVRTRMVEGTLEDPATGSAACGLGALLALKAGRSGSVDFAITQGVEMGRPSEIGVRVVLAEGLDAVREIELSGAAVKVMEGLVEYD